MDSFDCQSQKIIYQFGYDLMNKILEDTKLYGKVEMSPKFEGKQMIMVIQPL